MQEHRAIGARLRRAPPGRWKRALQWLSALVGVLSVLLFAWGLLVLMIVGGPLKYLARGCLALELSICSSLCLAFCAGVHWHVRSRATLVALLLNIPLLGLTVFLLWLTAA